MEDEEIVDVNGETVVEEVTIEEQEEKLNDGVTEQEVPKETTVTEDSKIPVEKSVTDEPELGLDTEGSSELVVANNYMQEKEVNEDGEIIFDPVTILKEADEKQDYYLTRILDDQLTTESLMTMYGVDGFLPLEDLDDYWDMPEVKEHYKQYGYGARRIFEKDFERFKIEFSRFELGRYANVQTSYDRSIRDISKLPAETTLSMLNMTRYNVEGYGYSEATRSKMEAYGDIRERKKNAKGEVVTTISPYRISLLDLLREEIGDFTGLVYSSDSWYGPDSMLEEHALFDVSRNGFVMQEDGTEVRINVDQLVSRQNLTTGTIFDGLLRNDQLEAEDFGDYASIFLRGPVNMAYDTLDSFLQLGKPLLAMFFGAYNRVADDKADVEKNSLYKWMNRWGYRLKSHKGTMTQKGMQGGPFGSAEGFLNAIFEVSLQVILASAGAATGSGAARLVSKVLPRALSEAAQRKSAVFASTGLLTLYANRTTYDGALERGFTTAEASVISGAMLIALRIANSSTHWLGNYEAKFVENTLRKNILTRLGPLFEKFNVIKRAGVDVSARKAAASVEATTGMVAGVVAALKNPTKTGKSFLVKFNTRNGSNYLYSISHEAVQEFTEELFQDVVENVATGFAYKLERARYDEGMKYETIYDEGYFEDAAKRYMTSAVLGGFGGGIGTAMRMGTLKMKERWTGQVKLEAITEVSSITDILAAGHKAKLIEVLTELHKNGELGPASISTDFNEELDILEPFLKDSGMTSLADMVFLTQWNDIERIDAIMSSGIFGTAKEEVANKSDFLASTEKNLMVADFASLMGDLIKVHYETGISMDIYKDLDPMSETELGERLPEALTKIQDHIEEKKQEVVDLKKQLEAEGKATTSSIEDEDVEPKTEEKEEEDTIGDPKNDRITLLEMEIAKSETVTTEDLNNLLGLYKKIRAIANGSANETYYIQALLSDNKVIGDKAVRGTGNNNLGDRPFQDHLMLMRDRAINDKKEHLYKNATAKRIEKTILSLKDVNEENTKKLAEILNNTDGTQITKKAYEHIVKLYDDKTLFNNVAAKFDPDNPNSVFKRDAEGNIDQDDLTNKFREVLAVNIVNDDSVLLTGNFLAFAEQNALKFFKDMVKSPGKALIPEVAFMDYGIDFVQGNTSKVFIDFLLADAGVEGIDQLLSVEEKFKIKLKGLAERAQTQISNSAFFNDSKFNTKNISPLFKRKHKGQLINQSLADASMAEINSYLESDRGDGIYTKKDFDKIDDIIQQITVAENIARTLYEFTNKETIPGLMARNALLQLRKTTLKNLDFVYLKGEAADSTIEPQPFKEYSLFSDFFTDFLYDPILEEEMLEKPAVSEKEQQYLDNIEITKRALDLYQIKEDGTYERVTMDNTAFIQHLHLIGDNLASSAGIRRLANLFTEGVITIPGEIVGKEVGVDVDIEIKGITALVLNRWLLSRIKANIEASADIASTLPYKVEKNRDILGTFKIFAEMFKVVDGIEQHILTNVAGYQEGVRELMDNTKGIADFIPIGKLNIKLEKALFDIYNNKMDGISLEEHYKLREGIDKYIKETALVSYNEYNTDNFYTHNTPHIKRLPILIGAITTDFTSFYGHLKQSLENINRDSMEDEKVLTAGQEFSAKYAVAFTTSSKFVDYTYKLRSENTDWYFSSLAVYGTGGSGKTTAVTSLGMGIATKILKEQGYTNNEILPISNTKEQISNIASNIPANVSSLGGMDPESLHELLIKAQEGDKDAIEALKKVGTIIIDEVTYIEGSASKNTRAPLLKKISDLVDTFNNVHNIRGNNIVFILLGDIKQSGSHNTLNGNSVPNRLSLRDSFSMPYLNISFRSRNSFLTDSIAAIDAPVSQTSQVMRIQDGIKFGTAAGRLYGGKMVQARDSSTNSSFIDVLNDTALVRNIEYNIQKVKDERAAGRKATFTVLLAPESLEDLNGKNTLLQEVMSREGNEEFFIEISADKVGGAEANYVIGELPDVSDSTDPGGTNLEKVKTDLFTLSTRAFDYIHIINKNRFVILPESATAERMEEGIVLIPDASIDDSIKLGIVDFYLAIFEDVKASDRSDKPATTPKTKKIKVSGGKKTTTKKTTTKKTTKKTTTKKKKTGTKVKPKKKTTTKKKSSKQYPYVATEFPLESPLLKMRYALITDEADNTRSMIYANLFNLMLDYLSGTENPNNNDAPYSAADINKMISDYKITDKNVLDLFKKVKKAKVSRVSYKGFVATELMSYLMIFSAEPEVLKAETVRTPEITNAIFIKNAVHLLSLTESVENYKELSDIIYSGGLADITKHATIKVLMTAILYDIDFISRGNPATTPDFTMKDLDDVHDDVIQVVQSLLMRNATESRVVAKNVNTKNVIPPKTVDAADPLFNVVDEWLISFTESDLLGMREEYVAKNNISSDDKGAIEQLFKDYPEDHDGVYAEVINRIDAILTVIQNENLKKREKNNDFVKISNLKKSLGIDSTVVSSVELTDAVINVGIDLKIRYDKEKDSPAFMQLVSDLEELKRVMTNVYGKSAMPDFKRDTLDDYKERMNALKSEGDAYTLTFFAESDYTKPIANLIRANPGLKGMPIRFVTAAERSSLSLFNFDKEKASGIKATEISMRGIMSANGYLRVYLLVTVGDSRVVVAELRSKEEQQSIPSTGVVRILQQFKRTFAKGDKDTRAFNVGTSRVIDVELPAGQGVKGLLYARAGELKVDRSEDVLSKTLADLEQEGLNIGPDLYIHTFNEEEGSYSDVDEGVGVGAGETIAIYSSNDNIDVGTTEHVKQLKKGQSSKKGDYITDSAGFLDSNIGKLSLSFKPTFRALKGFLESSENASISPFPSMFSYALQKYVAEFLLANKTFNYTPPGGKSRVVELTPNITKIARKMLDDINVLTVDGTHVGKTANFNKAYDALIAVGEKLQYSNGVNFLEQTAVAYAMSNVKFNPQTALQLFTSRKRTAESDSSDRVFVFNFDGFISTVSDEGLDFMSEVFEAVGSPIKLPSSSGDSDTVYYSKADPYIMKHMKQYIVIDNVVGVRDPKLVISARGAAAIIGLLETPTVSVKINSVDEDALISIKPENLVKTVEDSTSLEGLKDSILRLDKKIHLVQKSVSPEITNNINNAILAIDAAIQKRDSGVNSTISIEDNPATYIPAGVNAAISDTEPEYVFIEAASALIKFRNEEIIAGNNGNVYTAKELLAKLSEMDSSEHEDVFDTLIGYTTEENEGEFEARLEMCKR